MILVGLASEGFWRLALFSTHNLTMPHINIERDLPKALCNHPRTKPEVYAHYILDWDHEHDKSWCVWGPWLAPDLKLGHGDMLGFWSFYSLLNSETEGLFFDPGQK